MDLRQTLCQTICQTICQTLRQTLRRVLAVPLLVAALTLTACGGGDSSSSAAGDDPTTGATSSDAPAGEASTADAGGPVQACDLLTTDEVAAAVGSPVKAGIPSSGPAVTGGSYSSCTWLSADPDHPADTATVTTYPNGDAADSARGEDAAELTGLGASAFSASFASVWVYVGTGSFFAQWYTFGGTDADDLPHSQALAQAVVAAL